MLLFSFDYPPNDGGIARLCSAIAAGLSCEADFVSVVTQQNPLPADLDDCVVTVRLTRSRPRREWESFRYLRAFRGQGLCVSGIWYPEGLVAALAGVRPHIILAHGLELLPPLQRWRRPTWRRLQRSVLETADLVIANSHYTADLVRSVAPASRVLAVPLAVDHCYFTPGDPAAARQKWQIANERVICTVSRIYDYKGHDTVLRALAALPSQERTQFVYLVAGKGSALGTLKELARSLGVDQQVRWLGFVPDADLPDLYRATDLFVLPTREQLDRQVVEGFGLVFLEAQACAIPVVGTRTGGIPDAVNPEEGGWLIEQDDVDALTGIFHGLVTNPAVFSEMGRLGRQRVEREFTWKQYLARLEAALRTTGIELRPIK